MIPRHSRSAIFLHWFNACCWIFLLLSGAGLMAEHVQPVGAWWHDLWHGMFGARALLLAHIFVGCIWSSVYAIMLIICAKTVTLPFLGRVFRFSPCQDAVWCAKKALWLTVGPRRMQAMGIDPALPPQGFYNAGQRLVAVLAVVCGVGLCLTGIALAFGSSGSAWSFSPLFLQWLILLHFCFAAVMAILLPVHIYMAALAPGEEPALRSMLTGFVPLAFVRHHNPLWYEALVAEDPDLARRES